MDREPVLWDGQIFSKQGFNWTDYQDYMISDKALYKILCQLKDYGLVFLRGMPDSETAVEDLANRIDRVRDTFYGKTWNVRAIAQSKNIAYTNLNLGLHMDLLYFSSPPTYQILHCLRNKAQGGSSYFVDAFKTAQDIKITSPGLYDSLCTNHVSYHYRNDGQHYYHTHPTIQLSLTSKQVQHINYSPPFQAPFDMPSQTPEFQVFMSALNKFCAYTDRKEEQFELQLKEGDCVIFNNRRVLHARREFSGNGERWLKGAYFDEDGFLSKYRMLREKLKYS
ncbi:putative oxidoreductase AIM17 [Neolecta irregularis DAH-3]|uniref:Putative oxidoreductase AIM17 n=1 Tax=Neolecta irregularis (strain DAH-3) TaxID=1198029 RepID=A0A1U7LJ73_NEOID|nr:putative oxidoreductase AIM17 [Neolecta irregularis DAH-3]|eukprot:OLL22694.1 putative oxidoreductase AIM17 [Neolecta irregularis DAH-3]